MRAVGELVDVIGARCLVAVLGTDLDRLDEELPRQGDDRAGHRRGEQHRLPLRGQHRHQLLDVGQEAEVQHLVALVQHQDADRAKYQVALLSQVEQATGSSDDDVDALAQRLDLRFVRAATVDRLHPRTESLAGCGEVARNLNRQFAGRGDDQRLRCGTRTAVDVDAVEQRDAEAEGLPGAGTRLPDQVATRQCDRQRQLLDRECVRDAYRRERLDDLGTDREVRERGALGPDRRAGSQWLDLQVGCGRIGEGGVDTAQISGAFGQDGHPRIGAPTGSDVSCRGGETPATSHAGRRRLGTELVTPRKQRPTRVCGNTGPLPMFRLRLLSILAAGRRYPSSVPAEATSSTDPAALVDLLGVLAYGELSAFGRLAQDARLAPSLAGRAALSDMAAIEMGHYRSLAERLLALGADPHRAMEPFVGALDRFHNLTEPSTWLEGLVKAYVGDGLGADFYREVAEFVDPSTRALIIEVLADSGSSAFAVREVRAAIAAKPAEAGRLALWGRRLVGEALSQTQHVLAERESLMMLLVGGTSDLANVGALITRITDKHAERMKTLGLDSW